MLETKRKFNNGSFGTNQPAKKQVSSKWDQTTTVESEDASKEIQIFTPKNSAEAENRTPSNSFFTPYSKESIQPWFLKNIEEEDDEELVDIFKNDSLSSK